MSHSPHKYAWAVDPYEPARPEAINDLWHRETMRQRVNEVISHSEKLVAQSKEALVEVESVVARTQQLLEKSKSSFPPPPKKIASSASRGPSGGNPHGPP